MWSALFGSGEVGVLILRPTPSAQTIVAGFKSGTSLKIAADATGQTIGQILDKLNKYRGPDQQIRRVWDSTTDREIPASEVVKGTQEVLVKAESIQN
jgi:hypothetical protein